MIKLPELRRLLSDPPLSSNPDILALEKAAVEFVQTQTRRYFGPVEDREEILRGRGLRDLWLNDVPIEDADADYTITVEERAQPGDTPTIITDYELRVRDTEALLVRTGTHQRWHRHYEYTVTYRRGYAEGSEPADIRQLVKDLILNRWTVSSNDGLKGETMGGYSYTAFDPAELDAIEGGNDTIEAHRSPVVA